ncbi:Putative SAM-dependent rRNA methyltransferase SPB1 [Trachipleistophora hominis]|uniref:Putative SAM-dependent rRNA methyltransferase SPB1 n=1 Tax=Trachipleistophora hominis TaxID=72359 RepID=L7JSL3_TRAHO|nr:Putative SAM-dependent rRNA methyltransferase SPB1 [Trachipleistophora hominis]
MAGRKKIGKKRLDKYYHLAKEQGYRARSAYKLIQLNKKFNFLQSCSSVVDLCCAPGGWLQVAVQHNIPDIIGVDLYPIKKINNVKSIVGDITLSGTVKEILNIAGETDCVLHDGAPNVGVCWEQDAFEQNELVLHAIKISTKILKKDGIFLTKVFRSKDYFSILWVLNQLFESVVSTKPISSREQSAEIFVFCRGYKKPAKIDDKFFDANHVFKEKEINENCYKVIKFSEFFNSEDPKSVLETYSKMLIDVKGELFDKVFDQNYKTMLDDLKQIGKHDMKKILKKREKLIKYIQNGEYIEGLDVPVKETVVSLDELPEESKLDQIKREMKKKQRDEKKREAHSKIKCAKSKVFEKLASIDNFFEDRLFQDNLSKENKNDDENKSKTVKKAANIDGIDEMSSDEESLELNSDDKRLIVEMKNDREAFELRTVNKYALNDTSDLPKFYMDEQKNFNQLKSTIDDKNYKKVNKKQQEVMNRRIRRAMKFKKEIMEEISDENDRPRRLFKSCLKKSKKKPKVVVCSKGKPARTMKGRVKYVDRRMKKDLRKQKRVRG